MTGEKDYWSTKPSISAPVFSRVMRRNGFQEIKRYFHLADNGNLTESKTVKIDLIYDELLKNCQQFGIFSKLLSIDESVVPYRGNFSIKQYIRNKPIRVLDTNSDFCVEQTGIAIILSCIKSKMRDERNP